MDVEALSITEFQFSEQFRRAVEAKVEAGQRALQATNDLRRIEIEAQQQKQGLSESSSQYCSRRRSKASELYCRHKERRKR